MAKLRKRKHMSSTILSLPTELLSNILARLPFKDLLCVKLVSKPWYALISSLDFAHFRLDSDSSDDGRFLVGIGNFDGGLYSITLDFHERPTIKKINILEGYFFKQVIHSCNGLVLCMCNDDPKNPSLVLVNPLTLRHKQVPNIPLPQDHSVKNYGLVYDSRANDYKIVITITRGDQTLLSGGKIMIYSLTTDSWKLSKAAFPDGAISLRTRNGALINNQLLLWMFKDGEIRSFDVCSEQWNDVPHPDYGKGSNALLPLHLGVRGGCLCLLTLCQRDSQFKVLLMKKYNVKESWTELREALDTTAIGYANDLPLIYSKSGNEILLYEPSGFKWYNSADQSMREPSGFEWYNSADQSMWDAGDVNIFASHGRLSLCIQSIVSV